MADMKVDTTYFSKKGSINTEETLKLAFHRSVELNINQILIASNTGATALKALKWNKDQQIVVVTHSTGFLEIGKQQLSHEIRKQLESDEHVTVLTTTHAFGGVGRAVRMKLNTYQVDEIIAYTLRTFSQGVKVCCELTIMAADAGLLNMDEEVIAIGGSGTGADTALVLKPAHAQNYLDIKVLELICKPREG